MINKHYYNKVYKIKIHEHPMETEIVEIKEFKVEKLNPGQKYLEVSVSYIAREDGKVTRRFELNGIDTPVKFTTMLIDDVRKKTHTSQIEKQDETRDKIAQIMIRLCQQIKDFDRIKDHDTFMREYNKINCFKAVFPDVDV
jgi:HD superfamily phosphodiesterase